jgi:hypothetical protein
LTPEKQNVAVAFERADCIQKCCLQVNVVRLGANNADQRGEANKAWVSVENVHGKIDVSTSESLHSFKQCNFFARAIFARARSTIVFQQKTVPTGSTTVGVLLRQDDLGK